MNNNDNRLKAHKLIDHIFQDLLPAHGMAQRPEQIQLSHRMLEAMQDGKIALCDAGTGSGIVYLCHGFNLKARSTPRRISGTEVREEKNRRAF